MVLEAYSEKTTTPNEGDRRIATTKMARKLKNHNKTGRSIFSRRNTYLSSLGGVGETTIGASLLDLLSIRASGAPLDLGSSHGLDSLNGSKRPNVGRGKSIISTELLDDISEETLGNLETSVGGVDALSTSDEAHDSAGSSGLGVLAVGTGIVPRETDEDGATSLLGDKGINSLADSSDELGFARLGDLLLLHRHGDKMSVVRRKKGRERLLSIFFCW